MAIISDQIIIIGTTEITSSSNQVNLDTTVNEIDNTRLGDATRNYIAGQFNIAAGASGYYDPTVDSYLNSTLSLHDTISSFLNSDTIGDEAYSLKSVLTTYKPMGGQVGDQNMFDLSIKGRKTSPIRGMVAYKGTVTATGASTAFQLGATSATQSLYGIIHVTAVSGTSPTLDIDINSDDNSGMTSATTRDSFTQITAVTTEWVTTAGAITDDYYQLDFTVGGTDSPSFDIAVILAVQ